MAKGLEMIFVALFLLLSVEVSLGNYDGLARMFYDFIQYVDD